MNKKQVRMHLRAHPEFAAWVKQKPELVTRVKSEPQSLTEIFETWEKSQARKAGIKKITESYRSIVDQVQELHTLLQRVDHIVNNVKTMAQTVEGIQAAKLETTSVATEKETKKRKK